MAFDDIISMPALKPFVLAFVLFLLATISVVVQFPFLFRSRDSFSNWPDSVIRAYGPVRPNGVGILPLLEPETTREFVTPAPKSTVLREIFDRALHIRLDAPQKVDEESHKSELKKLESLLAGSLDMDQLVVQARDETAYAVQLFNNTLEAAFQSTGLLEEVKLAIISPIDLPRDTRAIHPGAGFVKNWNEHRARVLPWWQEPNPEQPKSDRPQPGQPKPDLSVLKNLTIQYPIPLDECVELLDQCSDLRSLHLEWVVAPSRAGALDSSKLVMLPKLHSMTIRATVDLKEFFDIVDAPEMKALDMMLACQASPQLYDILWGELRSAHIQGVPALSSERAIRAKLDPEADIQLALLAN
ncbi:hypothetical protein HGRIS_003984 [Hohenbuehelia grisea]